MNKYIKYIKEINSPNYEKCIKTLRKSTGNT